MADRLRITMTHGRFDLVAALTSFAYLGTGYDSIHAKKVREAGKACEHMCAWPDCDRQARDWSWRHTGPSRTGLIDGAPRTWGIDTADYWPLCRSHHRRFDFQYERSRAT